jgi:hypothetical protein
MKKKKKVVGTEVKVVWKKAIIFGLAAIHILHRHLIHTRLTADFFRYTDRFEHWRWFVELLGTRPGS